jgi:peptide deformylase
MKILTTPHPFLRHIAKPVISWDKKITTEVESMTKILQQAKDPEGVGLAATQVGIDRRLFIIDNGKNIEIYINPQITYTSPETLADKYKNPKKRFLEGCLSVPKLWGFVNRPYRITLQYEAPATLATTTKEFSDKEAAYIQHELDHLNGILFTDRIIEQKGTILKETEDGLVPIKLI